MDGNRRFLSAKSHTVVCQLVSVSISRNNSAAVELIVKIKTESASGFYRIRHALLTLWRNTPFRRKSMHARHVIKKAASVVLSGVDNRPTKRQSAESNICTQSSHNRESNCNYLINLSEDLKMHACFFYTQAFNQDSCAIPTRACM